MQIIQFNFNQVPDYNISKIVNTNKTDVGLKQNARFLKNEPPAITE